MYHYGANHKKNIKEKIRRKIDKIQKNKEFNGKPDLVIFSGAGVSQESGIDTFRSDTGLWNNYNVKDVATVAGFRDNPQLVVDFYNKRRQEIHASSPNYAHEIIANLEEHYNVTVVTQNIDDFHERAGSSNVLHLHGEINKLQDHGNVKNVFDLEGDTQDFSKRNPSNNARLRPYVVWFGEQPRYFDEAKKAIMSCDAFIVVGTSLNVQPAASLIDFVPKTAKFLLVDPYPAITENDFINLEIISKKAVSGFSLIQNDLIDYAKTFSNK